MFHVGEPLRVAVTIDSDVSKSNVVVGLQIFHESGVHVSTSTNRWAMTHAGRPTQTTLDLHKGRQTFVVDFPAMFLGDGKYFVNVGIAPKDLHFSPVDQLLIERRCATFGYYRDDVSLKIIYDPPSAWSMQLDGRQVKQSA
jgi:hypothetical protein